MAVDQDVAVAISGGGHRATVFGLGALLALTDAGLNARTTSISSVSGGSIANGIVMIGPDYSTAGTAAFEAQIMPALTAIAARGVLQKGAPATRGYLRALIGTGIIGGLGIVVALVGAFAHAWTVAGVAAVIGIIGLVAAWLLFHQRSARTGAAIDRELLGDTGLTLADVKAKASGVHHVICTTELQTGEPFYFTNRVVYGYRFGASTNAIKLPLSTAVQASACVPGAFAPRMIPLATLGVHAPTNRAGVVDPTITSIVIDDGGVYDNMSDQWEYGFGGRLSGWPELGAIQPDRAKFLIVVNGSGGWNDPKPIGRSGFAQEVQGLLRAQAVQYDVSTADRRQALYAMFRHAETGTGQELDGIFAQITDSPYRIPKAFCSAKTGHSDAMARRADAALAFLADQGYTEVDWDALVGRTSGAATTLARLGTATTAELLEHGYVLTMVNLYVLDDTCPLRPIDRDRFRRLCS